MIDDRGTRPRPEINAARIARRVLVGGHDVPIRKIRLAGRVAGIVTSSAYSIDGGATSVVSTFTTEQRGELCTD